MLKPKLKIYIAGQISGIEDVAFENFEQAERELIRLGYEPVNPMKLPHRHPGKWIDYMKEDLAALKLCDGIYMQENWRNSDGATIEFIYATDMGKRVMYQKTMCLVLQVADDMKSFLSDFPFRIQKN